MRASNAVNMQRDSDPVTDGLHAAYAGYHRFVTAETATDLIGGAGTAALGAGVAVTAATLQGAQKLISTAADPANQAVDGAVDYAVKHGWVKPDIAPSVKGAGHFVVGLTITAIAAMLVFGGTDVGPPEDDPSM